MDDTGHQLLIDYQYSADPNVIGFSLQFPAIAHGDIANGTITNLSGQPFYEAVLVNDTNTADAIWEPYTGTNITVTLSSGNGLYLISVGLKGLPMNATTTWFSTQMTSETLTPSFIITNPISSTVSQPMIQLQGLVSETLSNLTFDVSNALGVITGQQGYWSPSVFDANVEDFTTNNFQCYDIRLTNGLNLITLHATDLQGKIATTNVCLTLDYSSNTNPPSLNIIWPQDGTPVSGNNFTLQAQVDDDTATVTAQITDTNGDTNVVQGLVERNGMVLVNNLPLAAGTNILTVTAMSAAGHTVTTNLTLVQSRVMVTMDPLSSDQYNQSFVNVTGTISDSSDTVMVNGVQASVDGYGNWEADSVPVSPAGTAIFDIEAYVDLGRFAEVHTATTTNGNIDELRKP